MPPWQIFGLFLLVTLVIKSLLHISNMAWEELSMRSPTECDYCFTSFKLRNIGFNRQLGYNGGSAFA